MAFLGLDLFDPSSSDEPVSLGVADHDEVKANRPPPRSKTSVDLRAEAARDPVGTVRIRSVQSLLIINCSSHYLKPVCSYYIHYKAGLGL